MKFSIITPTFNSEAVIANNINSILNQTYSNFEHIIIDNESSDRTLSLVENEYNNRNSSEKLRIISEKDNGIAEAFNKGIEVADGEIIGILNSDDKYFDEFVLENVVNGFKDKKVLFVQGNIYFEDPVYGSNIRKPMLCPVTKAMPYNHPTIFIRKEIYTQYGFFDINFKYAMDFEFICRLTKSIPDFNIKGFYLDGNPLVVMKAGGASWINEMKTIQESKKALIKHQYWNFDAKKNYFTRKIRIKLKSLLAKIKMEKLVARWRIHKWEGNN